MWICAQHVDSDISVLWYNLFMENTPEVEQTRSADMNPALMQREQSAKKTWFFERGVDGMIFPCEEREAWDIVNNRSEWKRRDFKLVGVSDGTTYQRIVKESGAQARALEPEIEKLKAEIKRYEDAENNLLVNEAVDMEGDPSDLVNEANKAKVTRLRGIIDRLDTQLEAKELEYKNIVSDVVKRAVAAELEVARGHIEWPGNVNVITPDASPRERQKILNIMDGRL